MSEVDLIILDLDGGDLLTRCLDSIESQSRKPARIILWDNGSRIPTGQRLSRLSIPVELHRSPTNLGFSGGANAAFAFTSAPFVALVNNDVTLDPAWLSALVECIERDPTVCAVQSLIMAPDGSIDGAGIDISDGTFRQIAHGSRTPIAAELEPWGVSATATLYRRSALTEVLAEGLLFDRRFFAYYEDVELCARLRERGWHFAIVADPLAIHKGSASAAYVSAVYLRTRNRYLVRRRHRDTGRYAALLREDVRLLVRDLTRLEPGRALSRCRGLMAGLLGN